MWRREEVGDDDVAATVVAADTFAGDAWPAALTDTVVIFTALFAAAALATALKVDVPDWPGLSKRLSGASVDGVVKSALLESLATASVKLVALQPALSLFVTVTV